MSHGSISLDSFPPGRHADAYTVAATGDYFAPFNGIVKQNTLNDIHHFGYDLNLGSDHFSQSSSEDSCSQTSDSSDLSDEIGEQSHEGTANISLSSHAHNRSSSPARHVLAKQDSWSAVQQTIDHSQTHNSGARAFRPSQSSQQRLMSSKCKQASSLSQSQSQSQNATPTPATYATSKHQTKNVPFRPKLLSTNLQPESNNGTNYLDGMIDTTSAIPLDTSCVASDAQRSRLRVEPTTPHAFQVNRRRGRSIGPAVAPPKLRRDTDQTDVIVKMIVLFCVNLINSIWSPSGVCRDELTAAQSGANVLPLQVFITETLRRSKTSYSTLQIALYYLILLKQCLPQYGAAGQPATGCRAMQCGRRMFLTALILASKYLQDRNYSARAWSKISGLPLKEINENERRYLSIVCWDLHVPKNTFENWSKIVLNVCRQSMDPETCRPGFEHQPPPGTGPSGQSCFLQKMCKGNLVALRNWWLSSLRGLCTDIVRCPQKTENYVSAIMPFRDSSYLPRPVFESPTNEEFTESSSGEETPRSLECLPKLPNMERISTYFSSTELVNSPAVTKTTPSQPMLGNLPTPQTTPQTDMSRMWTPRLGKPNLRCRASATALGNLDKSHCPLANLETCPPPKPRQCQQTQPQWRDYEIAPIQHVPDRSLTSSPDSVVSDVFSMPARSRSSSISSTSSWMTSGSVSSEASAKERAERLSHQLNSVQQQFSQHQMSQLTGRRHQSVPRRPVPSTLQAPERPKTAFKVSNELQGRHAQTVIQQGTTSCRTRGSNDVAEQENDVVERETAAHVLANLQASKWGPSLGSKSCLQRTMTQVYDPRQEGCKLQVLKRSRSESLDFSSDKLSVPTNVGSFADQESNLAHFKNSFPENIPNWQICAIEASLAGNSQNIEKQTQHPTQPYLPPRMPIQLATQKRLALQVSPAAQLASDYLKSDVAMGRLGSVY